jgi:hypothetical protein
METIRNINHFIGIETENLLTSIENLGDDFFLIHNLDEIYQIGSDLSPINKKSLKMPTFLFLITHSEFYLGMVSFLRFHTSKSFISLRSALDCTFTAYYLLKYPDKVDVYLSKIKKEDNPEWDKIFRNIKQTIKKDIDNFPMAKGLPGIHEFCSMYAHSDALGILHRYQEEEGSLNAKFFDYEASPDSYKKWLACLLTAFLRIYSIYWDEIFKHNAGERMKEMEYKITEYQKRLKIFEDKYPLRKSS